MSPRQCFASLVLAVAVVTQLSAALTKTEVTLKVAQTPESAPIASEINVSSGRSGVQRLQIKITNRSSADVSLQGWTVQFPWVELTGKDDLLSTGGWDMGRSEARVHDPKAGMKVETGSYLLARKSGAYAIAGFITWKTFNAKLRYDGNKIVVTGDGEGRLMRAGETLNLETIWLSSGDNWQDLQYAYADEIVRENKIKLNPVKPYIGWATWDYFGRNWTYENVVANLDALLQIYPKADFFQIDGGWWPARGDYKLVRANLQPDGMKRIGQLIHEKKLTAGIHLDGMRGDATAEIAKAHPEYFLHDQTGKMLVNASVNQGDRLEYTFFDFSNPGAQDYFRDVMQNIRKNWGYDYIKVDFLRFGINEFIHTVVDDTATITPHNRYLTSVERFHLGMAAMREGMGKDAFFLACSSVFGPTFGHVDGLRSGADINPQFKQFKKCAVDNSGNYYLHSRVVHNDSDYHVVRAKEDQDSSRVKAGNKDGGNMTLNEAEMWTHFVALVGGPRLNSDHLPILREERRALFRFAADFPTAEHYVPLDFWSHARDEEDVSSVILTEAKGDVYLGAFNWTDKPKDIVLSGLKPADVKKVEKLAGAAVVKTFEGTVTISLPARHSSIFKLSGKFDKLRREIQVN